MKAWLAQIVVNLATSLASWIFAKITEEVQRREKKRITEEELNAKLGRLKDAYKDALDGSEVTVEQKKAIQDAARDLIRNGTPGL